MEDYKDVEEEYRPQNLEYNIKVIVESSINEPPYFEDELEANIQINKTSQA